LPAGPGRTGGRDWRRMIAGGLLLSIGVGMHRSGTVSEVASFLKGVCVGAGIPLVLLSVVMNIRGLITRSHEDTGS